jgi:CheY-like chemotaxis protein/class 3 adenylate cyclase
VKPIVVYVDDEPSNLIVFEAAMPDSWQINCFDSPLKALEFLSKNDVSLVVSDQRMPGMPGVAFLEIAKKTNPHALRVLVTGYSDEDLIIESVRKAQVHDYIRKPWDVDDLVHRMQKLVDTFYLEKTLRETTEALLKKNADLEKMSAELRASQEKEKSYRKELEAWAPPFILNAVFDQSIAFPTKRDLALITFDIVESSKLHDIQVGGRPVRKHILNAFSEAIIKHGGWRESSAGDSAYAHFGFVKSEERPCDAALAVASEFRTFLRNFNNLNGLSVECGVGMHLAKDCIIDLHKIEIHSPQGQIIQKSFDSSSLGIDLVHRIEKITHILPGSNMIMTADFVAALSVCPVNLFDLGQHKLKGQQIPVQLFLKSGDKTPALLVEHLIAQAVVPPEKKNAA